MSSEEQSMHQQVYGHLRGIRRTLIARVIQYQNGMVMVLDGFGDQMPEYQGRVEDVKDKIDKAFSGQWEHRIWKDDLDKFRSHEVASLKTAQGCSHGITTLPQLE